MRRTKRDKIAPDKICLNHFITTGSLRIPFESLYNAQTYAHLAPLYFRNENLVGEFFWQNYWVKKFLPYCDWPALPAGGRPVFQKTIRKNQLLRVAGKLAERALDFSGLGGLLERLARKVQKSRINTNLPGRITVSDEQLEFHPYSVEKTIIEKFNRKIFSFGFFGGYKEPDSGLRRDYSNH